MLVLWIGGAGAIYQRWFPAPAGGAKVWDDGFNVRVRLTTMRPLYVGAAVAGILAFVSVFIVAFAFGSNPSIPFMLAVWGRNPGGGLLACLCNLAIVVQGGSDLVIDSVSQPVTLPRTFGRKADIVVRADKIHGVEIERLENEARKEAFPPLCPNYRVHRRRRIRAAGKLAEWWTEGRARELVAWLCERLQLEPAKPNLE